MPIRGILPTSRTRKFFVPCVQASEDPFEDGDETYYESWYGWILPSATRSWNIIGAFGRFVVPQDFISDLSVQAIITPLSSGNIYCAHFVEYGAIGEPASNHEDFYDWTTISLTASQQNAVANVNVSAVIDDIVSLAFHRDTKHASDDGYALRFHGWLVEYTAEY